MGFWEWCKSLINYCSKELANKDKKILELTNELNNFNEQIDYSFVPIKWKEYIGAVTTKKAEQDGIKVEWDIRDLLNSTIFSRQLAEEVINKFDDFDFKNQDEYFNILCLAAANVVITRITYLYNSVQFNKEDVWNNGDTAIVTGKGDCDLSTRVFVRVMNDVLDKLKMFEYKKYIFQDVGFYTDPNGNAFGHSWARVYDPIEKKFKLIECTLDKPYSYLPSIDSKYDMWFCLNFKKVWYQHSNWGAFL